MPPKRSDFVLTTHVPDSEANVLVLHSLNIKPNGGNSCHYFAKFQFIQDGGFTSSIKSNHQYPHLLLAKQPPEHAGQCEPHDESVRDDLL